MTMQTKFTKDDVGRYFTDGTFGHQHHRRALADLIESLNRTHIERSEAGFNEVMSDADLIDSLRGDMPDDAWDEREALEILNEHTAEGLVWDFEGGDLLLMEVEEES